MSVLIDRMKRAARLDPALFGEVAGDEGATSQAVGSVVLSSVAAGIGSAGIGGPVGLVGGALAALVGWFVWAFTVHFVGTRLLAEPETRTDLAPVLRATGFAAAPGVIRILGLVPLLGTLANFAAQIWMLAAFVVAVREVMAFRRTGRAVAVCIVGFVIQVAVFFLFAMLALGSAFMFAAR
jgi:hypothetical protein